VEEIDKPCETIDTKTSEFSPTDKPQIRLYQI